MILDSSLKVCFVMLENFCTFVTYYILEGRETCQSLTGIFYACTLHIPLDLVSQVETLLRLSRNTDSLSVGKCRGVVRFP